jgi:hypothetical protein
MANTPGGRAALLISSFGLGASLVAPQHAAAARCIGGSSLVTQIGLAGMEADVSGSKALSRMLAQVGLQLDKADALDAAGKLKGERHKLGAAIHGLTRFRGRVESSRQHPSLDQAVADRLATEATSALETLRDTRASLGTPKIACPPPVTTTLAVSTSTTTSTTAAGQTTTSVTTTSTTTTTHDTGTNTTTTRTHLTFTFHPSSTLVIATTIPPKLDYQSPAIYGEANLSNGFSPDPYSVGMTAGGAVDVSYLGGSCRGFATSAPDLRVNFGGGGSSLLRIYFIASNGDPAMVVNDPYGNFYCVDDSFGTVNPTIDFNNPAGGSYDVWIASYSAQATISGTLYITENSGNHP